MNTPLRFCDVGLSALNDMAGLRWAVALFIAAGLTAIPGAPPGTSREAIALPGEIRTNAVAPGASPVEKLPTLARMCTEGNRRAWVSISGFCHLLDYYRLGPTDLPQYPT